MTKKCSFKDCDKDSVCVLEMNLHIFYFCEGCKIKYDQMLLQTIEENKDLIMQKLNRPSVSIGYMFGVKEHQEKYEYLKDGDIIQHDDQFLGAGNLWYKANRVGDKVEEKFSYRRKIKKEDVELTFTDFQFKEQVNKAIRFQCDCRDGSNKDFELFIYISNECWVKLREIGYKNGVDLEMNNGTLFNLKYSIDARMTGYEFKPVLQRKIQ